MKKIIVTLCILVLSLQAVSFKEADSDDIKRVNPTKSEGVILSYASSINYARKCVVNISTQKSVKVSQQYNPLFNDPFFRQFFDMRRFNVPKERMQRSLGSGVIISEDGYIVTNNHVVEGADKVVVSIPGDKKDYEAKIVGTDDKSDLAVIKIDGEDLNAITIYNSDKVEVGDVVFAIGNPFGVGETVTKGIVSATNRSSVGIVEYEDFIQTDAPINPGNSGGALVNSLGYLVGINSAIISRGGGNVGIGFAIPTSMVKKITTALIEKGSFERAYLGVSISDVTEDLQDFYNSKYGAIIMSVQEDSAAERAGLKRGDLIVAVNGKEVKDSGALKNAIGTLSAGSRVSITYIRDGKRKKATVKLQSGDSLRGAGDAYEYEGLSLAPLNDMLRQKYRIPDRVGGIIVVDVKPNSRADKAGFAEGDVILQVENREIGGIEDFKATLKQKGKKRYFIRRRGAIFVIVL
jgi:serine protease Do